MAADVPLEIGLSAVIVAAGDTGPRVLAIPSAMPGGDALPFGPFDPVGHRTFELGLRGWVLAQTGFSLDYVEQLYTFGDRGRDLPIARQSGDGADTRVLSVGYLALTREAAAPDAAFDAVWRDWYDYFPWEDHREGRPGVIDDVIRPRLLRWAGGEEARRARIEAAFPALPADWADERVLDRYELLYEAGLVYERARDTGGEGGTGEAPSGTGAPMASDHRRILATAVSRLRGKLRYRPIVFDLMPETFTLSDLQRTVEGLLGLTLHKQNFRRALEKLGFVEGTGQLVSATGGRPAELFRYRPDAPGARARLGISTPVLRAEV